VHASALQPSYRERTARRAEFCHVYQESPGASLSEMLMLGEEILFRKESDSASAGAPLSDAVLIHPRAAVFAAHSSFSHTELRQVQETYYQQEPYYTTETYNCGMGGSYRTCTRSVTRYRSVARQRWVTKNVSVLDSSCTSERSVLPREGGVYLLELAYRASGVCTLSCYEQIPLPGGEFKNQPCAAAPPPP
jgi:hypothetical protein